GKIRMFVSGGAPLELDALSFFSFLGMPVLQGYGLSESAPVVSSNLIENYRLGSCGHLMPWLKPENGGDITFKDEDGNLGKNVHGQLLVKGNCVMKGYWRHTDASAKTMEDGWLNTGDVGHMDQDGYLFIHGRNSSMIVLYGGEKLHPEYIEDTVKSSPLISEAMVIGEKCKNVYVCVNVPKDEAEKHSPEELHRLLKAEVERLTANLAPFQKPKDVLVLPEFTQENGTMTATLKVRRFKIKELYKKEIEEFLEASGEQVATKKDLAIPSSRIVESLDAGTVIVGVDNVVK
ncbi:MAG: AMP-binding protein, partial [Victivallales bacterium]|nr:AMP-binding protein [Victivallales bacterium]